MTNELTKVELMKLMTADLKIKTARMKEINKELDVRLADLAEIQEKITRGGVQSLEELASLLQDLENHLDRVKQLKAEGNLYMADFAMDTEAINKAK